MVNFNNLKSQNFFSVFFLKPNSREFSGVARERIRAARKHSFYLTYFKLRREWPVVGGGGVPPLLKGYFETAFLRLPNTVLSRGAMKLPR